MLRWLAGQEDSWVQAAGYRFICAIVHASHPILPPLVQTAEVAFTGDTTIDFVRSPENKAVLDARLLVMECTFLDDAVDQAGAKEKGHMHIRDIAEHAHLFKVRTLRSPACV